MEDSIKVKILGELNKPLHANEVYLADTIRERLGISKDNSNDDWLVFYKELSYCIEGGLIAFISSLDKTEFEKIMKSHGLGTFMYMNCLVNRAIRITPQGEAWLAQMKSNSTEKRATRNSDVASNNSLFSGNKVGLINIEKVFDFSGGKFKFNILGRSGSVEDQQLGVILMVLEIGIAGISMQYIKWNMTDSWILVIALVITAIIFNGKKAVKKLQER